MKKLQAVAAAAAILSLVTFTGETAAQEASPGTAILIQKVAVLEVGSAVAIRGNLQDNNLGAVVMATGALSGYVNRVGAIQMALGDVANTQFDRFSVIGRGAGPMTLRHHIGLAAEIAAAMGWGQRLFPATPEAL